MKLLLTYAAIIAAVLLALADAGPTAEAAREPPPDTVELTHNTPPEVEQQTFALTGRVCDDVDLSDCVTNAGPCLWDPDDVLLASSPDGTYEGCLMADWAEHSYQLIVTGHKRHDLRIELTLDPPLNLTGDGTEEPVSSVVFDDERSLGKSLAWVRGCVNIGIDRSHPGYQEIPYQGGGGGLLGIAVPTTVRVRANGALSVAVRGIERC